MFNLRLLQYENTHISDGAQTTDAARIMRQQMRVNNNIVILEGKRQLFRNLRIFRNLKNRSSSLSWRTSSSLGTGAPSPRKCLSLSSSTLYKLRVDKFPCGNSIPFRFMRYCLLLGRQEMHLACGLPSLPRESPIFAFQLLIPDILPA
jgi:hypothetical protein